MSIQENEEIDDLESARQLYAVLEEGLAWNPKQVLEDITTILERAGHKGEYHLLGDDSFMKDDKLAFEYMDKSLVPLCYMRTAYDAHNDPEGERAVSYFKQYCEAEEAAGKPVPDMKGFVEFLCQSAGYSDPRNTYEKGLADLFNELEENGDKLGKEMYGRSQYGSLHGQWQAEFTLSSTYVSNEALTEICQQLADKLKHVEEFEGSLTYYPAEAKDDTHVVRIISDKMPAHIQKIYEIITDCAEQALEKFHPYYIGEELKRICEDSGDIPVEQQAKAFLAARKLYAGIRDGQVLEPEASFEALESLLGRLGKDEKFYLLDDTLPKDSELAREYIKDSMIPCCHLQMAMELHIAIDATEKGMEWLNNGFTTVNADNIDSVKEKAEQHYERSKHAGDPVGYSEGLAEVLEQFCDMPIDELRELYNKRTQHGMSLKKYAKAGNKRAGWASMVSPQSKVESIELLGTNTGTESIETESHEEVLLSANEMYWEIKLNKQAVGSRVELRELSEKLMEVLKEKGMVEPVVETPLRRDGSYTIIVAALQSDSDKMEEAFDLFKSVANQSQQQWGIG